MCVCVCIYRERERERERLPQCLSGKKSVCNAGATGDAGSIPELGGSLGGGHSNPLHYSCLENPHRKWSLAGYSPWVAKNQT